MKTAAVIAQNAKNEKENEKRNWKQLSAALNPPANDEIANKNFFAAWGNPGGSRRRRPRPMTSKLRRYETTTA